MLSFTGEFEGVHRAGTLRHAQGVRWAARGGGGTAQGGRAQRGFVRLYQQAAHTRLKVLYFDGTGLWLMTKRLEKGHVLLAACGGGKVRRSCELAPEAFALLTDGIDMHKATPRARGMSGS
jgi:hypothetical protein